MHPFEAYTKDTRTKGTSPALDCRLAAATRSAALSPNLRPLHFFYVFLRQAQQGRLAIESFLFQQFNYVAADLELTQQGQIRRPSSSHHTSWECTEKNKNRLLRVHARSAAGHMQASPRGLHPPLTPRTFTLHLPLPPPTHPFLPCLTYLAILYIIPIWHLSNKHITNPSLSPTPHPSRPTTPSLLHTVWRYPSSTISLNLVNHSHGRSKHHFLLSFV